MSFDANEHKSQRREEVEEKTRLTRARVGRGSSAREGERTSERMDDERRRRTSRETNGEGEHDKSVCKRHDGVKVDAVKMVVNDESRVDARRRRRAD